jgi:PAS domain S-box-containing protein
VNRGLPPDHERDDPLATLSPHARSEARLQLALSAGGLGVWEWDPTRDEIDWDHSMETLFGVAPGDGPCDLAAYFTLVHPDDRDEVLETVQLALATGEDFSVVHRVVHPDGTMRWLHSRGHPISNGDQILSVIGVTRDITTQRDAEVERERLLAEESAARAEADAERARLEFIIEAKNAMSQSLDLNDRLRELVRIAVPRFADGSAVHLVGEGGEVRLHALAHRDPSQVEIVRDLFDRYPVRLSQQFGIGTVIREGRSGWLPHVSDEMLEGAARSETHLEVLRRLDVTSAVAVPLIGPDGAFGAVTFITTGGRRMREDDLVLVEQVCSRVAILLRNAQLFESREAERLANRYQAALLTSVLEASVDGVLAVGPDGEVLTHNQRFLDLWELDPDLIAEGDDALLASAEQRVADPAGFIAGVKRAYEEKPLRLRDQVALASGRVLDRHGTLLTGPDGEYLGYLWSFRDVTLERAQSEAIAEAGRRSAMLARTLQQSLLPPRLPRIPGIDLAARYHPAFEGLDIGGDFYDVFTVGDDWILVIGDVCGKGAEAAAVTALARYSIRASASHDSTPASILTELNSVMLADTGVTEGVPRFATVCCIRLRLDRDTVHADVACGGHHPPFVLRAGGQVESAGLPGTLLGVFDEVVVRPTSVDLGPGDAVVLLTDGVLEARDQHGVQLDPEGVERVLVDSAGSGAQALCSQIATAALTIQDGVARDDIAVLVARVQATGT